MRTDSSNEFFSFSADGDEASDDGQSQNGLISMHSVIRSSFKGETPSPIELD